MEASFMIPVILIHVLSVPWLFLIFTSQGCMIIADFPIAVIQSPGVSVPVSGEVDPFAPKPYPDWPCSVNS